MAGAGLTLLFALMAFRDESALALGERESRRAQFLQLARSVALGLVGPILFGCLITVIAFIFADIWLPMGYPYSLQFQHLQPSLVSDQSAIELCSEACTEPQAAIYPQHGS